eukprot:3085176-Pyramimonas_sp.AAC.1
MLLIGATIRRGHFLLFERAQAPAWSCHEFTGAAARPRKRRGTAAGPAAAEEGGAHQRWPPARGGPAL